MTASGRPWSEEEARRALATVDDPAAILPSLQAVQDTFGYVPDEAVAVVAASCNASRADVFGVLTYYRDLRRTPPPRTQVRVCMGEACQSVGARALRTSVDALAGPACEVGDVFCLGNCALGPAVQVDGTLLGRATADRVRAAIERGAR